MSEKAIASKISVMIPPKKKKKKRKGEVDAKENVLTLLSIAGRGLWGMI